MRKLWIMVLVLLLVSVFEAAAGGAAESKGPIKLKALLLYNDENRQIMHKDFYLPNLKKDLPKYDVEIELGASDSGTYLAKLRTYLSAGDLPDVFFSIGSANSSPFIKARALLALEPYFEKDGFAAKFVNLDKYKYTDGHIYALEAGWDLFFATGIYYNKDLFAEANIAVPKTYDDFLKVCAAFTARGITPFAVGGKEGFLSLNLYEMMVYVEDPTAVQRLVQGKAKITDTVFMNAAKRVRQLYDMKAFQEGAANYSWPDVDAYFRAGKSAMLSAETWSLPTYASGANPLPFFDYMGYPSAKPGVDLSKTFAMHFDPVLGFSVAAASKHPADAVKLLEWFTAQDAKWALTKIKMPVMLDVGVKLEGVSPVVARYDAEISHPDFAFPQFDFHFNAEVIDEMYIISQQLVSGNLTPEDFIKQADAAIAKFK